MYIYYEVYYGQSLEEHILKSTKNEDVVLCIDISILSPSVL